MPLIVPTQIIKLDKNHEFTEAANFGACCEFWHCAKLHLHAKFKLLTVCSVWAIMCRELASSVTQSLTHPVSSFDVTRSSDYAEEL